MPDLSSIPRIVLLSGPICAGKSAFVDELQNEYNNVRVFRTSDLIKKRAKRSNLTRRQMQRFGSQYDRETRGAWVAQELFSIIVGDKHDNQTIFILDCVRTPDQVAEIRESQLYNIHHIHLTADEGVLRKRFNARKRDIDQGQDFDKLRRQVTEKNVGKLADLADIVVDTARCGQRSVMVRATALLGIYPRTNEQLVDVLVGGQYGSEGKGNIVAHIAPEYDFFIRVGGPNAGHQVFKKGGADKFFHLPSGTNRAPNAHIVLGPGAVIYPPDLLDEIQDHQLDVKRLSIDPQAMIIRDEDREAEVTELANISSTSQGVGFASARKLTGRGAYKKGDLFLAKDCEPLRAFTERPTHDILRAALADRKRILLEGTQGTALSVHHGEYPHVTSRDTTVAGCLADAGIAPKNVRKIILVLRTYPIRVGGPSGSMGSKEVDLETIAERSGLNIDDLKIRERATRTGKSRRFAEFDWELLRKSVQLNGPTDIALTFADYIDGENENAFRFDQLSEKTVAFVEELERVSGRPVTLISTGFSYRNIIDRRTL